MQLQAKYVCYAIHNLVGLCATLIMDKNSEVDGITCLEEALEGFIELAKTKNCLKELREATKDREFDSSFLMPILSKWHMLDTNGKLINILKTYDKREVQKITIEEHVGSKEQIEHFVNQSIDMSPESIDFYKREKNISCCKYL